MSVVPRLLMSLASGKLWLVLPFNLACGACVWLRDSYGVDPYDLLLQQEFVVAVFAVWGAILANKARWDYAREMITRKMLLGENSATATLLNLMCDVVVELDANLKLVRQAPKLEAMLALHSTRAATLQQYMPNEVDQSRFQDVLCPEGLQGDVSMSYEPGALHSTLRDSWGNHISVEMFYIQFRGPDLCLRTFVGLREFADQQLSDLPSFPPKRKHSRGKQKPDVAEKKDDKQTEQGDRCLDAGITNEGHQQEHGSQQAAPGQLHGTHLVAAMPSAIEKEDDSETKQGDLCSDTTIAIDGHQGGHSSQQATPGQLRGTPPVAATPLALPDFAAGSNRSDEQSLASSKSSVSLAGTVLLNPTLMGTWDLAKDLTLMETISRWNVHVSKTSCCPLHCATMEASKSLKRLMRKGCSVGFHLDGNRQCRQCGLLGDGGGCCLEECTKHGRCKACFSTDFVGTKTSLDLVTKCVLQFGKPLWKALGHFVQ